MTEFLKPGIEEMCSVLPPALAAASSPLAERRGRLARLHWGMEVNTTSVSGFLRFWLLAKLRRWRPKSYRYPARSNARSKRGCASSSRRRGSRAISRSKIAECARLIKGYGDTHKRGTANYRLIETRMIRPILAGQIPLVPGHRRDRQRARRGAHRPRGRSARALPRRDRAARHREHRCRDSVARMDSGRSSR